eukprot:2744940-Rhodomonas_salina.1
MPATRRQVGAESMRESGILWRTMFLGALLGSLLWRGRLDDGHGWVGKSSRAGWKRMQDGGRCAGKALEGGGRRMRTLGPAEGRAVDGRERGRGAA